MSPSPPSPPSRSNSFNRWEAERLPRLVALQKQYDSSTGTSPPNPNRDDENLRGYVVALSAHFQAFCRDLCTEVAQHFAALIPPHQMDLKVIVLGQLTTERKLDHGNPNYGNLKQDFGRLGFDLKPSKADAANKPHFDALERLNKWRNVVAHAGEPEDEMGALSPNIIAGWHNSCVALAEVLNEVVYNRLLMILGSGFRW